MDIRIRSVVRSLSTIAVLATACGVTQVQAADALSVVVDSRGEIYRVSYLCDPDPDCAQSLERLTNAKVKQGASVAIGSISGGSPINYVFVGNSGRRGEIKLLTQDPDLTGWQASDFSSDGTTAMVVARNSGTLYVARQNSIEAFKRDSSIGAGYDTDVDFVIDTVEYPGGPTCQDIVGLEEWPAFSGNLIAICNAPSGAFSINIDEDAETGTPAATLVAPNSLGVTLSGGGITRVPVPPGIQLDGLIDYLLLSSSTKEIIAIDLDRIRTQRNLVSGSGQVRDLAPALCNFADPGNNVDDDDDVDGPCFSFTQSGNSGDVILAELVYDPVRDRLNATVVEQIDDGLKNTYGIDFINKSTVLASTCVPPAFCGVGFSLLSINKNLPSIPENSFGVETRGPFYDSRFIPGSDPQRCVDDAELHLGFTNIPMLENFSIGPEFCSRDGFFFVDIVADDGVLGQPVSGGISSWETPGSCWEPGPLPFVSLDEVEYGILSGDQFDLLRVVDDVLEPIDPPGTSVDTTYVNNRFVQDRLVGCATRRRAGSRLTFLVDDLFGNGMDADIGAAADPLLPGTTLFDYGAREIDESFDILVDATQSGCSSVLSGPCTDFGTGNAQAAFGWSSQQYAGVAETVAIVIPGSVPTATFMTAQDVDVHLLASGGGGNLGNKTVSGITAVGVTQGGAGNEISSNGNELITASFSTAVRGFEVNDVPMVIKSFTGAFLYDGPYGDVNEYLIVTATPADGSSPMVGILKAVGSGGSEAPTWAVDAGAPMPATSEHSGGGVIRTPEYPFGNRLMTSLTFKVSTANDCGGGGCDGSLSDIEVEIPSRIDNLAYSYNGLLKALCPISDRPAFVSGATTPSRPSLCGATMPSPLHFNSPANRRNISGELHATTEALARFISHNICQLDLGTEVNPGGVVLEAGGFCTTPAEWSVRPTPPTP